MNFMTKENLFQLWLKLHEQKLDDLSDSQLISFLHQRQNLIEEMQKIRSSEKLTFLKISEEFEIKLFQIITNLKKKHQDILKKQRILKNYFL